jgi:RimJ/RimL family protein N-acetyltransferase
VSRRITLRLATTDDSDFLFDLRTDPETVKQSVGETPTREQHDRWLESSLAEPTRRLLIAHNDDFRSVGTGRLDNHFYQVELSWTIAADCRGQGYGRELIVELMEYARTAWPGVPLLAQIKPENWRSLQAAFGAGFRLTGNTLLRLEA